MVKRRAKIAGMHPACSSDNPGSYVISETEGPEGSGIEFLLKR